MRELQSIRSNGLLFRLVRWEGALGESGVDQDGMQILPVIIVLATYTLEMFPILESIIGKRMSLCGVG